MPESQAKTISISYLSVMLERLGKNDDIITLIPLDDIITICLNVYKMTWAKPFQNNSTWFQTKTVFGFNQKKKEPLIPYLFKI